MCPPGYNYDGSECKKPQVYCPEGYELLESGFCSRIETKCPQNTILYNGQCIPTIVNCPEGSYPHNNQCYRNPNYYPQPQPLPTSDPIYYPQPPINVQPMPPFDYPGICPAGFQYHNRRCYRCPQGYTFCNNQCVRGNYNCYNGGSPSNNDRHITINIIPKNNGNSSPGPIAPQQPNYNIVNHFEPINNTVSNVNNITNPVSLNNINTNNVFVYTETQCNDGSIRTTIVKNNETVSGCVDLNPSTHKNGLELSESEEDSDGSKKCCEIVTPKQCRQVSDKWICAHKKYRYCGHFCIAPKMYLKTTAPSYQEHVLTMPPPKNPVQPCMGRFCPAVSKYLIESSDNLEIIIFSSSDCNGCIGGSYNCSPECYSSPCEGESNGCNYLNQQDFCSTVGGQGCNE